ncbi:TIGR03808 family TAT-translocated repetitive protein [Oricola thermophila]|uniref:TIGR03808 family TAT-translocated repetitive protein n=1 Tax=Oricola thermophila TaxID=2742145 RepID=A0A6N1VGB7_9HYPH|nr:TIGR03808 family TAT-translocated repetitive protein [Oricola thermophila]QKV18695.1 TIGR03808 family TAT-translocated repetitive protein [Oricola thermophila]
MDRRRFLCQFGTAALIAATPLRAAAQIAPRGRGTINPADHGVIPDSPADQTAAFQTMVDVASSSGMALFLPGGRYVLSGIRLPSGSVIEGIPGQTRIVSNGGGPALAARNARRITLRGIATEHVPGTEAGSAVDLVEFLNVEDFVIEECDLLAASGNALRLHGCSGQVRGNTIARAGQSAVYATDSTGLTITDNTIDQCRNGGIIVHRYEPGHDGTIVTGNRIRNTGATNGGTGQWGNAINFFRADNVIAANNMISNSAFTAIRGNAVRNMQVTGNTCLESGETAIFAEFEFRDAIISENIIDGAANGISATNLDHGGSGATITGNIVRNLRTAGPYEEPFPGFGTGIIAEADAAIAGNLVQAAALYGINAGWGPFLRDVLVSGNTIRDSRFGIGVSAVEGAGRALISGNIIDARETGIQAHEWGRPIAPDLLVAPGETPANIILAGNVAVSG